MRRPRDELERTLAMALAFASGGLVFLALAWLLGAR